MGFLKDKKILITGVASTRSIAWGIAQAMRDQGAALAFSYQGDKLLGRVEEMATQCGSDIVLPLDVSSDSQIADCFKSLATRWDGLDGIVHSIGFAPRDQLEGDYIDAVTREGFAVAHDISSYSFAASTSRWLPGAMSIPPIWSLAVIPVRGSVCARGWRYVR